MATWNGWFECGLVKKELDGIKNLGEGEWEVAESKANKSFKSAPHHWAGRRKSRGYLIMFVDLRDIAQNKDICNWIFFTSRISCSVPPSVSGSAITTGRRDVSWIDKRYGGQLYYLRWFGVGRWSEQLPFLVMGVEPLPLLSSHYYSAMSMDAIPCATESGGMEQRKEADWPSVQYAFQSAKFFQVSATGFVLSAKVRRYSQAGKWADGLWLLHVATCCCQWCMSPSWLETVIAWREWKRCFMIAAAGGHLHCWHCRLRSTAAYRWTKRAVNLRLVFWIFDRRIQFHSLLTWSYSPPHAEAERISYLQCYPVPNDSS